MGWRMFLGASLTDLHVQEPKHFNKQLKVPFWRTFPGLFVLFMASCCLPQAVIANKTNERKGLLCRNLR